MFGFMSVASWGIKAMERGRIHEEGSFEAALEVGASRRCLGQMEKFKRFSLAAVGVRK